jgi:hypothetical protein
MKKLMFVVALAIANYATFGQTASASKDDLAVVKWEETTHDFGKIPQGVPVTYEFKFTNKGKTPFIMTNVQTSCGCTTPSWTRDPVAPGGEGHVKVTYNASNPNAFDKTITVSANIEGGLVPLHIKGEVQAAAPKAN